MEYESDGDTSCNRCARYCYQRIDKGTGGLENRRQVETIQRTTLMSLARIVRWPLENWGDLLSLRILWEPIRKRSYEKFSKEKINKIMNSEKKTYLTSSQNIEWRTVKTETNKINQVLLYIWMKNITELNKRIYAQRN